MNLDRQTDRTMQNEQGSIALLVNTFDTNG